MNMLRKNILLALFLFSLLLGGQALAQAPTNNALDESFNQLGAAAGEANLSATADPRYIVANIIRVVLGLLGTIFVVLAFYAGFLWMTAGGEEDKISKAKKLLYDGVIGLAVILSAYAVSYFVFQSLVGATTGVNPFGFGGGSGISNFGPNPANYSEYTY